MLKKSGSQIKGWKALDFRRKKVVSGLQEHNWKPGVNAADISTLIPCVGACANEYASGFHICETKEGAEAWIYKDSDRRVAVPVYVYKKHITNIGIQCGHVSYIASQATIRPADYKKAIGKAGK